MNDIKRALDSGMKNMHFDKGLVLKRHNRYSWTGGSIRVIAAVALVMMLTVAFLTGTGRQVFAHTYQSIADILNLNETVNDYSTVIGSSVFDNGISVTLYEVIVSEEKLIVSINISDGIKMKRDEYGNRISPGYDFNQINVNNPSDDAIKIYLDGNKMPITGLKGTGQAIDDYTMNYVTEYYVGPIEWEKVHELKISMSTIEKPRGSGEKCEKINGNWEFSFAASGAEMAKASKVITLDDILEYNGGRIVFDKFLSNSYEKVLYASTYESDMGKGYGEIGDIVLIGYDDLGNKVSLYAQEDYHNKQGAKFICVGGTDISNEASTLTLQVVDNWIDEFNPERATVTINIK